MAHLQVFWHQLQVRATVENQRQTVVALITWTLTTETLQVTTNYWLVLRPDTNFAMINQHMDRWVRTQDTEWRQYRRNTLLILTQLHILHHRGIRADLVDIQDPLPPGTQFHLEGIHLVLAIQCHHRSTVYLSTTSLLVKMGEWILV